MNEPDDDVALDEDDGSVLDDDSVPNPPQPYSFDPDDVPIASNLLNQACAEADTLYRVDKAIEMASEASAGLVRDSLLQELRVMLWYRLTVERGGGRAGAELGPLSDDGNGWYWPSPIRSTAEPVKELWVALASVVDDPVASARLNDLCFCARVGNGGAYAERAARCYLKWPASALDPLYVSTGLARAWTLSRMIGDGDLEADGYRVLHDYAAHLLAAGGTPGALFPLLEALSTSPRTASHVSSAEVELLLSATLAQFVDSHLQVRVVTMLRRLGAASHSKSQLDRLEIAAHLDEATRASHPAVRMHHLELAANTARRYGVADLESDAVKQLQAISVEELGLVHFQVASRLPAHITEAFLRDFDEAYDWREAIHRFLHTDSPTGDYQRNLKDALHPRRRSLRDLLSTKRLGGHGLPQQTLADDDERLQERLVATETMRAQLYGLWHSMALERIATKFGVPARVELHAFLIGAYRCDATLADSFAEALCLYWEGRREAAIHLAVPKVEAGVRALLLELDEAIYRVEVGDKIGQFPGLGALLPHLTTSGFDEDWERFLGTLLLPRGLNLRNLVAHGFVHDAGPIQTTLVLRALGLVMRISTSDTTRDAELVRGLLREPLVHDAGRTTLRTRIRSSLIRSALRVVR